MLLLLLQHDEYVKRIILVVEMPSNVSAFHDLHCKYSTVLIRPVVAQICSLPVETGRCRASMRRFFFNSTSRQCEEFRFGGCEGNANRFDTEKDCNDFCGCKLRLELSVPCQHRISMFKGLSIYAIRSSLYFIHPSVGRRSKVYPGV